MVELADTGDLKSPGQMRLCGFESRSGYWMDDAFLSMPARSTFGVFSRQFLFSSVLRGCSQVFAAGLSHRPPGALAGGGLNFDGHLDFVCRDQLDVTATGQLELSGLFPAQA